MTMITETAEAARLAQRGADGLEDASIIGRVLAGEQDEYAVLVRKYQERLYRHALGMVLERDTAAELVQDTMVTAYERLRDCRDPACFGAWLFRAMHNRCLDHLRDPRRKHVRVEAQLQLLATDAMVESNLEDLSVRRPLDRALAALPPLLREPFLMKHLDGLSYEEMSEALGASVGALKMRVMRAREQLRAALAGVVDR
jgi:RNA polymerase sigma-70 factor (ECF subfamily)